jgi:hypothetical protein
MVDYKGSSYTPVELERLLQREKDEKKVQQVKPKKKESKESDV